jgi:hypothetical protein
MKEGCWKETVVLPFTVWILHTPMGPALDNEVGVGETYEVFRKSIEGTVHNFPHLFPSLW